MAGYRRNLIAEISNIRPPICLDCSLILETLNKTAEVLCIRLESRMHCDRYAVQPAPATGYSRRLFRPTYHPSPLRDRGCHLKKPAIRSRSMLGVNIQIRKTATGARTTHIPSHL